MSLHVGGLATACALSVEVADTDFTEPTDWNAMLKAPDVEKWLAAVKLESMSRKVLRLRKSCEL